jgi:uncharacterized phage-associated protein
VLAFVLDTYGDMEPFELVPRTHKIGSPWQKARFEDDIPQQCVG